MDAVERESRRQRAASLLPGLAEAGVTAVATTFVDNSGITRVKTVPLDRFPHLAAWGVGASTSFDYFRFDDWLAAPPDGRAPVGDVRILPDVGRVVPLAAQPGWAWTPGERYDQDGAPHPQCSRLLLRSQCDALAAEGFSVKAAFEIEWVLSAGDGDAFVPAASGPGYGMSRLISVSDYARDLLDALDRQDVEVVQFHPEYASGQLELSVEAGGPIEAADTAVLVRSTIRAVGQQHGLRTSFSPKVEVHGVGNGGHVHLSLWRDVSSGGQNLMASGDGAYGLTEAGEAFAAGILDRLPALLAIGAPSVASYLRLVPSHWAGVFGCWGLENREAAVRMVTGSAGEREHTANLEVKCFDLTANPYLVLAGLLAAGAEGLAAESRLPEPVEVDPAVLPPEVLDQRGIRRLPTSLVEAAAALAADDVLRGRLGSALVDALLVVRASESELFADASTDDVVRAFRWVH